MAMDKPADSSAVPQHPTSFGAFKPVGQVLLSFASARDWDAARQALTQQGGVSAEDIRSYTDRQMLAQVEEDLRQASPIAALGQEMNLLRQHQKLAEAGYHWLLVKAADDERAARVAELARRHGAQQAQHYGNFIIVELIEQPADGRQSAESPARGLDVAKPNDLGAGAPDASGKT